ncbi:MAG: hypothetical protein ACI3Z0_03240 [Candidatus Cryptobacteroides sp.]
MASLKNEIVKFIADIQLDPQQAAAYQKNLADCERSADALRKSISETTEKMEQMRSSGQESTQAYQALKKSLDADTKALKEATKGADKYAEALGINSMSLSQLQKHAKQVRAALANTHKEANPKVWQKYNDELKKTEARIREVKAGGEKAGSTMKGLGASIAGGFTVGTLAVKAIGAAINVAKKAFQTFTTATQTWADQWAIATEMAKAGWQQFIANIGQGTNVMKASIKDAMEAAREAAKLRDELFERQNSYKLMEADARVYINTQMEIANNSANDAKTRMDALDRVIAKENELAEAKKSIAQQDMDAAMLVLKTRTQMNDEQIQSVVDQYEQNREIIQQAQEYNKQLKSAQETIELWSWTLSQADDALAEDIATERIEAAKLKLEELVSGTSEDVKQFASLSAQYNLANDELVKAYIDAKLAMKQADEEMTAASASQARKRGTLQKQIDADEKAARDKAYQDRINAAQEAYHKELLVLKQQLARREITESEFNVKSEAAEISMLNAKIAINQAYGKDVTDLQSKIVDKQLATQRSLQQLFEKNNAEFKAMMQKMNDDAEKEADKLLESLTADTEAEIEALLDSLPEDVDIVKKMSRLIEKNNSTEPASKSGKLAKAQNDYQAELADLESMHELQLISEEEFLARKKQLHEEYSKNIAEISVKTWQDSLQVANQFLDAAGNMVNAMRDAELNKLDAQMQAELTAAGDNAEERERIEAEYEQKKLDTQKKYADVDMAIQIAKTIAAGALAAIQSFAQLGPIAGAVMAAVIAATTAAEVASIVQQRNAIKNSSVSSSGGSGSGSNAVVKTREVTGYADGGYTGDGGRFEPAGIVHRGEYVVAAPELRDPSVAREVARIERKRLGRMAGRKSAAGYADGGYVGDSSSMADDGVLVRIYSLLKAYIDQTPMSYVVLSQLEAKQDYQKRVKSKISLK